MILEHIHTANSRGEPTASHDAVQIQAGAGIVGDRHGRRTRKAGRNITLVEAEVIEHVLQQLGWPLDLSISRRNLVTRGVRLNELIGREFNIGGLLFRGVELCEPCGRLGRALATADVPSHRIVRLFAGRGGLRADALSSGVLRVGAAFEIPALS